MAVVVNLDKLLVEKKMTSRALAAFVGITEQNLSLLKSGKVKGIRFDTLSRICEALECQPVISSPGTRLRRYSAVGRRQGLFS